MTNPDSTVVTRRDAAGRWRPGASGNPGGRRRSLAEPIRAATEDGAEVVAFMVAVMRGEVAGVTVGDRLRAAGWLADHGFGRPAVVKPEELDDGGELKIVVEYVNPDRLARDDDAADAG